MNRTVPWSTFLKDVLLCSLGAYGGPEAHFGVFNDQLVQKKKYLTDEELVELIALTGILPGPSSTQTIISVGHKVGGPLLGLLTMVVWALPVIFLMTFFSFLGVFFDPAQVDRAFRFVGPMAVGFILLAAYRISKKVVKDTLTFSLFILGALITYFFNAPWVFPVSLLFGGVMSVIFSGEKKLWNSVTLNPPWGYFIAFCFFAVGGVLVSLSSGAILPKLFESFYRYGYLVIGGGQVVIPMMFSELVEINQFLSSQEFLTGYGLVQGMPGPMFSFSAYAGALAASSEGPLIQALAGIMSGITIFLPGVLLIFFVYPIWERLKSVRGIKISLKGITAVAGGLLVAAGSILLQRSGFAPINVLVTTVTLLLLLTKKIPAPIIVVLTVLLGYFL